MPTTSSLKILLEYAQKQNDTSAKKLGQLNFQQQEAEKKLHLLLQYRQNYQSHFQDSAIQGMNQIEWLNFLAFMNKLDAAITEQRQAVTNAQQRKEAGGSEFRSYQRKLKSYDTLSQRQQKIELQQQTKHDQMEQDEYASNAPSHNQFAPKKQQT
tara:strand:+ start:3272 stop:3736 length:465 start_codon:yes stop_codon:yes gene_type:complete